MAGQLQDVDPDLLTSLARELGRTRLMREEHDRLVRQAPRPGSIAAADLAEESMSFTHDTAHIYLSVALDHLQALDLLVERGLLPAFACMSLLRVSLETALAALWIVEPHDWSERRARGFAMRWASHEQRRKFVQVAGTDDGRDRHAELLDEAEPLGLVYTLEDKSTGEPRRRLTTMPPNAIELTRTFPPPEGCEWLYRYLSGYSHGSTWAMGVALQKDEAIDLGDDMFAVPASAPDSHLTGAAGMVVDTVAMALGIMSHMHEPINRELHFG